MKLNTFTTEISNQYFQYMKRIFILLTVIALPAFIWAQTATIKMNNFHIEVNGEKVEFDKTFEETLTHDVTKTLVLFEQDGIKYGIHLTYRKGKNRIKLARRGFASKDGMDVKNAKREKDMQEMRTSITGKFSKRVVENIVLSKKDLLAINVTFNYELIYK